MTATLEPHQTRGSEEDLLALVRYWGWERTIEDLLPNVIERGEIKTVLQPIFQLLAGVPVCRGYEVLSRFPLATRIPVGLWFGTAHRLGLSRELETAAVRAGLRCVRRIPDHVFVAVNASMEVVSDLLDEVPEDLGWRLVIDLPNTSLHDQRFEAVAHRIRSAGAKVAIDDVPLDHGAPTIAELVEALPDVVKVDVLGCMDDSERAVLALVETVDRLESVGITVVAERVERATDLAVLSEAGIQWAQGFSLSRPVEV